MGIDFYSVDNPLLLASWASFFRDQYITAIREGGGRRSLVFSPQEHEGQQRNIFPPPPGVSGSNFSSCFGMSKVARTNYPSYFSPTHSTSGTPHPRAESEQEQEVEAQHHPSVQHLINNIIKSQAMMQSSDVMETVFRRFPFWCGRVS
jgi:hypothetical protein